MLFQMKIHFGDLNGKTEEAQSCNNARAITIVVVVVIIIIITNAEPEFVSRGNYDNKSF